MVPNDHLQVIRPVPRDVWLSVFTSDPDALPSQAPEWVEGVCDAGLWRDASRLYVTESGRRIILPLVKLGVDPLVSLASPRHGWGFGGVIADGGVSADDVAIVSSDLAKCRKLSLWVRPNPLHADLWDGFSAGTVRIRKLSHIVDLEGGVEGVRTRLHPSARKGIKTAEKMNVRVETAYAGDLLPLFFDLAVKSRAFWAQRQHEPVWLAQLRGRFRDSLARWRTIATHLGQGFQVTAAWHEGRPVAAVIVLQKGNAHGARAAMDPSMRHLGANHLINWVVLQNAVAAGARHFHMGESATSGASAFKRSFGARPCSFDEFLYERIPFSRADFFLRYVVKKLIGYREGGPGLEDIK